MGNSYEAKKLEATITLEYNSTKTAASIADAVSPDNFKTPVGIDVETQLNGKKVVSKIKLEGKTASTLIATIDDLLESVSTAEKTLHIIKRK